MTYYAYMKSCFEIIDIVEATSRLNAAIYFAQRKNIPLKDWINIYTTYNENDLNNYFNKQIIFEKNDEICKYTIKHIGKKLFDTTCNDFLFPKYMKIYKLKSFIKFHELEGWNVTIK